MNACGLEGVCDVPPKSALYQTFEQKRVITFSDIDFVSRWATHRFLWFDYL